MSPPARTVVVSKLSLKPSPKSSTRMFAELFVFIVVMRFDFKNPANLSLVQGTFLLVAAGLLGLTQLVGSSIKRSVAGEKKVWYPKAGPSAVSPFPFSSLFGEGASPDTEWEELTLNDLEERLAGRLLGELMQTLALPAIFSLFFGIHYLAGSQIFLAPLALCDNPLVRKYFLADVGHPPIQNEEAGVGIYGERDHVTPAAILVNTGTAAPFSSPTPSLVAANDPSSLSSPALPTSIANAPSLSPNASTTMNQADLNPSKTDSHLAHGSVPPALTPGEMDMERAIMEAWESREPLNVALVEHLVKNQGRNINYRIRETGQTLLHSAAGSLCNGFREIGELLFMGADPWLGDHQGHNALHWAAIHAHVGAVEAFTSAYTVAGLSLGGKPSRRIVLGPGLPSIKGHLVDSLSAGLNLKCVDGLTPLETALAMDEKLKRKEAELVVSVASAKASGGGELLVLEEQLEGVRFTLSKLPETLLAFKRAALTV